MPHPRKALGLFQQLALDVTLSILVIGFIAACGLSEARHCLDKARLSEAFSGSGNLRQAAVEEFAVTGELTQGGEEPMASDRTGPHTIDSPFGKQFTFQRKGGVISVSGTLLRPERQIALTFHSAIIGAGVPFNVIWLCGNRRPPLGWIEAEPPTRAEVPPDLMPSVCRENGAP